MITVGRNVNEVSEWEMPLEDVVAAFEVGKRNEVTKGGNESPTNRGAFLSKMILLKSKNSKLRETRFRALDLIWVRPW
jgi:hypothetical protein